MKKATEYGAVEIWMNERVMRACASSCADFLYGFREVYLLTQLYACVQFFFIWGSPSLFSCLNIRYVQRRLWLSLIEFD